MLYNASTPAEYLNALDNDWRKEKLMEIRDLILGQDPDMIEGIDCKMLGYSWKNQAIFNLNAQAAYVSLYVGTIRKVKDGEMLLKPFNLGKGCIRVKKSIQLKDTQLEEFIKRAIDFVKQGGDIGC